MESGWERILEKMVLFRGQMCPHLAAVARLSQQEESGSWESSGRLL